MNCLNKKLNLVNTCLNNPNMNATMLNQKGNGQFFLNWENNIAKIYVNGVYTKESFKSDFLRLNSKANKIFDDFYICRINSKKEWFAITSLHFETFIQEISSNPKYLAWITVVKK